MKSNGTSPALFLAKLVASPAEVVEARKFLGRDGIKLMWVSDLLTSFW